MKPLKQLKLNEIISSELSPKELKELKGGRSCVDYNCTCSGSTFTDGLTNAILDEDSSVG